LTSLENQPLLFSEDELRTIRIVGQPTQSLEMSSEALLSWKQRIFQYQQQIKVSLPIQQGSLFDLCSTSELVDPDSIQPFSLPQQNTAFWRWKVYDEGVAALYFVIDHELPILLYVGETVKSNQRWKGEHDCKRYLMNYVMAHRAHDLPVSVNISFWFHAPTKTRSRQRLESSLIYKWRSPFNKENWEFWGTPFVGK
jgi:hypothetical protein